MSCRIGIIGAGGIVQLQHLPFYKKSDEAEVAAICDLDRNKAGALAEKYSISRFYQQADDLFASDDIDAVMICTPTNSHMPLTLAALSAGKHVLVERPIARTYQEAARMVKAANSAGKILMVGMNHRFRPDSLILKNFISEGELGDVYMVRSGWMKKQESFSLPEWMFDKRFSGGGVMMDIGIQMLDLCLWLIGCPKVQSVDARSFNRLLDKEVEDAASVFIKLEGGKLITVNVGWCIPSQRSIAYIVFHGDKGTAWLNPLRIQRELHGSMIETTPGKKFAPLELYNRSFENEVRHFIESIRNNREPVSSGEESLVVLKIVETIYRSAREQREIVIGEKRQSD